jgi:hypothetical protein
VGRNLRRGNSGLIPLTMADGGRAITKEERPHMPSVPHADAPFSEDKDMEMLWGRLNGLSEAIAMLQHGHNLLASSLEEIKGRQSVVVGLEPP